MDLLVLLIIGLANLMAVSLFTMSGGIGLVIRPIMLFFGVPPQIMIGTVRVSSILGSVVSQSVLQKAKKIDWYLVILLALPNILGGLFGIYIITSLDQLLLKQIIGVLLILVGLFLIIKKDIGVKRVKAKLGKLHYLISYPIMFILGFLLLVVGGTGFLSRLFFIFGYGKTYIEAAAVQKAINFWQTLVTTFVFIFLAIIDWPLLVILLLSSALGNYIGTKFVLKSGEKYLRVLLLIVVFISGIKLAFFP